MRAAAALGMVLLCGIAQGAEPKTVTNTIGMVLIELPAGTFTMGSPAGEKGRQADEEQVAVTLTKPFGLGKTEVTQGQFKKVMGTEPWVNQRSVQIGEDNAASYVNWDDATAFCQRLTDLERKSGKLKAGESYRLPTEAEWEYACRAGTQTTWSFGNDDKQLGQYAWFDGNTAGEQYAHAVGLKKPNPAGLFDMHGNVWEWCSDWYDEKLSGGADPVGPEGGSNRVYRGGGWWYVPGYCRSANRLHVPSNRLDYLGFRVARSQSETVAERRQQGAQAEPAPQVAAAERPVQLEANSIGMELIEIPAGTFTMGSPAGEKNHRGADEEQVAVTLTEPFLLGKTEVTQGQWQHVMGTEPWKGYRLVQADKDCPATYVDWNDATAFCQKLTDLERKAGKLKANEEYRLPTEAQWEYACRAGTQTTWSFGNDEQQLGQYAWFDDNADSAGELYAHKVGMKKPNPWGLHDMHGNVWEWCSDLYDEKLSGGADPVGPEGGFLRVIRGGCWWSDPDDCRSANRSGSVPSNRGDYLGFRVARSQSETVAERRQQGAQAEPAPQVAAAERPVQLEANSIGMELVSIPKGTFTMGKESRAVDVIITKPFLMGKTEVTQGQFKKVMGTEPWVGKRGVQIGEDNAASHVDWDDATAFCQKLTDTDHKSGKLPAGESYRLPTAAEWEYACRAGTKTTYSFGNDASQLGNYGWFDGNADNAGEKYAHAVGMKKPNPWGLHDMHGNVWEWCSDWYGNALPGGTDPVGPERGSNRVSRGGGWGTDPKFCRSSSRFDYDPSNRNSDQGFRVARSQSAQ